MLGSGKFRNLSCFYKRALEKKTLLVCIVRQNNGIDIF